MRAMRAMIDRLFLETPHPDGLRSSPLWGMLNEPWRTTGRRIPALDCQLMMRSGYTAVGILTDTQEGALRLICLANANDSPIIADHYFSYDDVMAVVLARDIPKPERSSIITAH